MVYNLIINYNYIIKMISHLMELKLPFIIKNMVVKPDDSFIIIDFKSNIHLINPDGSEQKKWNYYLFNNEICGHNLVYNNSNNSIYFQIDRNSCKNDLKLFKFNLKNETMLEHFCTNSALLLYPHNKFMIDGLNRLIVLDGYFIKIITNSEKILSLKKSGPRVRHCKSFVRSIDSKIELGHKVSDNSNLMSDMNGNIFIITHESTHSIITKLDGDVIRMIDLSMYKKKSNYSDVKSAIDHNDILYFLFPQEKYVVSFDKDNLPIAKYEVSLYSNNLFFNSQNELIVYDTTTIKIFRT